jgi:hypothetical protein
MILDWSLEVFLVAVLALNISLGLDVVYVICQSLEQGGEGWSCVCTLWGRGLWFTRS